MKKKNKNEKRLGPILIIILITFIIMVASLIFSTLQFEGQKATIINGTVEMSLITVRNIFSVEGLQYLISSCVTNFQMLKPVVVLIMSLMAASILETSGLLKHISKPFQKLKPSIITFITVFIGIISSFIGEYSYIILLPLVGIIYKYLGKNSIVGIITMFLGISIGYGAGLMYNYNTYLLGTLTQLSATIEVDKNYTFNVWSSIYIMIASTMIISVLLTTIIEKFITPKFNKPNVEIEETNTSKKAFLITLITFIVLCFITLYMLVPGLPGSGLLLDTSYDKYIAQIFSETSTFSDGIMFIYVIIAMICGAVYGYISKNVTNLMDYNTGLSKSFNNIGYIFVLMFFASIMTSILSWTNLDNVIATNLINLISTSPISGLPLIIVFFILVLVISFIIPNTLAKWTLMSPLLIPLFMRANLTPDFTQFIFSVADGIGKIITPFSIYFIIMLGFLQKYNYDNKPITIFGTIKLTMPVFLLMAGIWLFIILAWYIVGIPLGIGTYATL